MKEYVLSKNNLRQWLSSLAADFRLIAPVRRDDVVMFEETSDPDEIDLHYSNTKEPPKKLFFPQYETLFSFDKQGNRIAPNTSRDVPRRRMIFAIRPCDAASLDILDKVFDDPVYKDPYYIAGRANTVIVSLACARPGRECFCTSLGLGPQSRNGADVLAVDIGNEFYLEPVTDTGSQLLSETPALKPAEADIKAEVEKLRAETESLVRRQVDIASLAGKLDKTSTDFWKNLHERCLKCGVCSFLCPTCHCFDMSDETDRRGGRRIRTWDCCMFDNFTLEASGHNPRPTGAERIRQRIMHKLDYFVKNHGIVACVGCGRCAKNCPVGMNIAGVLNDLAGIITQQY